MDDIKTTNDSSNDAVQQRENLEREAINLITKYFEYNSNVNSDNCYIQSLCGLMTSNVKVDYPSFETNGESDNNLAAYQAHVSKSLGIADKISKHQVYATSDNDYKFEHLLKSNEKDDAIISIEISWIYEMEWINCWSCMFKYICCCVGSTYKTFGINKYRLKYDTENQLKICYVQTRQTKK